MKNQNLAAPPTQIDAQLPSTRFILHIILVANQIFLDKLWHRNIPRQMRKKYFLLEKNTMRKNIPRQMRKNIFYLKRTRNLLRIGLFFY